MISALIFTAHLFFILFIFTKKWQEDSLQSAFINAGLIILLFSVGWSISTMILKLFVEQEGLGIYFDRDTISLTLLSLVEDFFFKFYYNEKPTEADKEM
jgi:hypothetical protein